MKQDILLKDFAEFELGKGRMKDVMGGMKLLTRVGGIDAGFCDFEYDIYDFCDGIWQKTGSGQGLNSRDAGFGVGGWF